MTKDSQLGATRENSTLIVIDIQEKLHPHVEEPDELKKNVKKLIEFCQIIDIPIILSEQYPKGLGSTIEEIKTALKTYEPEEKTSFSCCGVPDFVTRMRQTGRKVAIIVGIETHVCVFQTTRDLLEIGYEVHIIEDAVSSRKKIDKRVGVERMKELGATISSTEMFMFEVLKQAGTPEFKQVAPLLKQ